MRRVCGAASLCLALTGAGAAQAESPPILSIAADAAAVAGGTDATFTVTSTMAAPVDGIFFTGRVLKQGDLFAVC